MTTSTDQPQPSRRERQRRATYEEIIEVSRRLLGSEAGLSLRAVATEMGMTAPALYRYVANYQALVLLIAQSILDDVVQALGEARGRYSDDDPAAQILASAVAFRTWARANRDEFALIFANTATVNDQDTSDPGHIGARFDEFFGDMFVAVWERYEFAVPPDDELDPVVVGAVYDTSESNVLPCVFPDHPAGLSWMFARAWMRLYGTVTLEVFGHMDPAIIESGALFLAMLEDNARDLAFGADWPRLQAVVGSEMRG